MGLRKPIEILQEGNYLKMKHGHFILKTLNRRIQIFKTHDIIQNELKIL